MDTSGEGNVTLLDVMSDDFYYEDVEDGAGAGIGAVVSGVKSMFSFGIASVMGNQGSFLTGPRCCLGTFHFCLEKRCSKPLVTSGSLIPDSGSASSRHAHQMGNEASALLRDCVIDESPLVRTDRWSLHHGRRPDAGGGGGGQAVAVFIATRHQAVKQQQQTTGGLDRFEAVSAFTKIENN